MDTLIDAKRMACGTRGEERVALLEKAALRLEASFHLPKQSSSGPGKGH